MDKAIANIVTTLMITEETVPRVIWMETNDTATLEPFVSEGQENELRKKNTILAQNNTEDIVKGYNVGMKDVLFSPEAFAITDGGTLSENVDGTFHYVGPEMGKVVTRTPVTLDIYTEEKDGDGSTVGYQRFRFKHCKGTPVKFSHQDGSFFAPEYNFKSRPKRGEQPIQIDGLEELPPADATAEDLLAM